MSKIYTVAIPRISKELIDALDRIYPAPEITPTAKHADLLYQAGQRSVIDRLRKEAGDTVVSGDPSELRDIRTRTGAIVRHGS